VQLLSLAWDYRGWGEGRTVDVHVRRLRAKLGAEARRVETVRGFGYRFDPA
jgi:DNA-binding response OmpR family regulator